MTDIQYFNYNTQQYEITPPLDKWTDEIALRYIPPDEFNSAHNIYAVYRAMGKTVIEAYVATMEKVVASFK